MAVTALPRSRARAPLVATVLPAGVLLATLLAPLLDLLRMVQPGAALGAPATLAATAASGTLLVMWVRYPRTTWLAAAALAAVASMAMRIVDADVAPALSLLAILALGTGGGFASQPRELELLFPVSPASPDGNSDAAPRPRSDRREPPRAA